MNQFFVVLTIFLCLFSNNGLCQTIFSNEFLYKNLENIIGKYKLKQDPNQNTDQIDIQSKDKYGLYKLPNSDRYGLLDPSSFQNNFISNEQQFGGPFDPAQFGPDHVNPNKYGLYYPQNSSPQQIGIIEALHSIAYHDTLQCIPKLLCEFMVGNRYSGQDSSSSLLPNIDLSSILGYINALGGLATPLLVFGKAALVGYTANGDDYKCTEAYPRCPRDPDRLVDYLNNHNGGFFRFFNGLPQKVPYPQYPQYPQYHRIQKRIQTRPVNFVGASPTPTQSINWKFPNAKMEYVYVNGRFVPFEDQKYQNMNQQQEFLYENGKFIPLNKKFKSVTFTNIKIPHSSQLVGVAFPDRMGTGELIIDTEKFFAQGTKTVNFNNYRLRFPEKK